MTVARLLGCVRVALLPLCAALALFPAHVAYANPVSPYPNFWASDREGNLYGIWVNARGGTEPTDWNCGRICSFTQIQGESVDELEVDQTLSIGIATGSISPDLSLDSIYQLFSPTSSFHECDPMGGTPFFLPALYTGLEYVNGVLYGTSVVSPCGSSTFSQLDPASGAVTIIGPTGVGTIAGLAWDGNTNTLYGVTGCGNTQLSQLIQIDMATGAAHVVGSTGVHLASLEFDYRWQVLFAGGDTRDRGHLYAIDRSTGAARLIPGSGMPEITGLGPRGSVTVPTLRSTWGRIKVAYH